MLKKAIISLLVSTSMYVCCSGNVSAVDPVLKPRILDIQTSPVPNINQWVIVPRRKSGSLSVEVKAEGPSIKKVNFWLVPAKSKSWEKSWDLRELLGEDTDGSDGWSTTINYGEKTLLTFLVVELVAEDGETDRDWFYLVYKK